MQINSLSHRVIIRITGVFFDKKLRSCQSELINALLDISYHEPVKCVLFLSGNTFKEQLLDQIAVLVLVDQDLGKKLPVLPGSRCGSKASILLSLKQDLQCHMLHVTEVDHIFLSLFFLKPVQELYGQCKQCPDRS